MKRSAEHGLAIMCMTQIFKFAKVTYILCRTKFAQDRSFGADRGADYQPGGTGKVCFYA